MKITEFAERIRNEFKPFRKIFFLALLLFSCAFVYLFERVYYLSLKMEISKRYEILKTEKIKTSRLEYELNELISPEKVATLSQRFSLVDPAPSDIYTLKDQMNIEPKSDRYWIVQRVREIFGSNLRRLASVMR